MSVRRISILIAFTLLAACADKPKTAAPSAAAKKPVAAAQETSSSKPALCAHGVPADQCTKCLPELIPAFKELGDWCEEHGLPESHCRECNPSLTFDAPALPADWCREHAVPESMCTKCNPGLVSKFVEAGDYCREHGVPESVCPWCHPEKLRERGLEPPAFPEPGTRIRFKTKQTAEEAGIRTTRVAQRPFTRTLEVVGRIIFNQNKLARLSARGEALVLEVKADVGDAVTAGQPLATLASADVGEQQARIAAAKSRVDAAEAALKRESSLVARGISPRKDLESAQAEAAAARAEL
ncbi:MAG: efflux RND transporter periplasmic adaptor subunit, partial [Myxococcaceae bacterium]